MCGCGQVTNSAKLFWRAERSRMENARLDSPRECGPRRSRAPIKRIVLYRGDRLFNESKIVVKQFLGSRTGIDRASAIRRRHDHLCGHEGAGHSGGVLGGGHGFGSCRWFRNRSNSLMFSSSLLLSWSLATDSNSVGGMAPFYACCPASCLGWLDLYLSKCAKRETRTSSHYVEHECTSDNGLRQAAACQSRPKRRQPAHHGFVNRAKPKS